MGYSQLLRNKYTYNLKRFVPQWKQKFSLKNLQYLFKIPLVSNSDTK